MKVTLKKSVEAKIRANARRGARALDRISPDWYKTSNLSLKRLEMTNACDCVWGQLAKLNKNLNNKQFQEVYGHSNGSATPGYVPNYDPSDEQPCHVDPKARMSWTDINWLPDEERKEVEAIQDAEWKVLQDEWESLIRIRRNTAKVVA